MKKWANEEIGNLIDLTNSGLKYKDISKKLNRTTKSIERKLNNLGYKSNYRKTLYHVISCKFCNKDFKSLKSENRIFCSKECQLKNLNKNIIKDYNKTKICKCIDCGCDVKIKVNTTTFNLRCDKCKKILNSNNCKFCNEKISKNKICNDCKPYLQNIQFFKKLKTYSKGKKLNEINEKSVLLLSNMYHNKKYSRLQISEILNIDKKTLYTFFIKNNFNLRSLSDSISNSIYQGRTKRYNVKTQYKCGWHTTWNDIKVYYRSSYELNYCHLLDNQKIEYFMEKIRIKYFDSILNKERISIPDFYLPETNEIIEIKSNWTFDEQNMKDKIIQYKKNGYNVKLILEHKEYKII